MTMLPRLFRNLDLSGSTQFYDVNAQSLTSSSVENLRVRELNLLTDVHSDIQR